MDRVVAAIAIGSNLGDRVSHLAFARDHLNRLLADCRFSTVVETAPVGVDPSHGKFLNAAAVGQTALGARDLLEALLALEQRRGRRRPRANAPRTLDLDLVLFGELVLDEPGLSIPHPRFRDRGFVLAPLAEVGANLVDPVTKKMVIELLRDWRRARTM